MTLHGPGAATGDLEARAVRWIQHRLAGTGAGVVGDPGALTAALAGSVTDAGLGLDGAWRMFADVAAPNNVGLDSNRFLAFIPCSPSAAAVWMDAIVGTANFSGEAWLEAAGAIAAEQHVLQFLADQAGLPAGAGGCFMSGGSIGNLSALAVAREQAGERRTVVVADTAHASVHNALHLLGLRSLVVDTGHDCRLTGAAIRAATAGRTDITAIVASAGSTNAGVIDDLSGCADAADELNAWLHVDGAYGLAAMLLPELRSQFAGIERADSFIVDPHKWLFAPVGSCALFYRDPALAAAVHTQHGPYIESIRTGDGTYNPSDLGYQLTRRASGLPLWFALALHGVDAHRKAIRAGVHLAAQMADALDACPTTQLVMRPTLGVVLFRRDGWGRAEWQRWAADVLAAGIAFVAPTTHRGEPVGRLVFMHPLTPPSVVSELIAGLR
ncbi:MAG: aminotransferase class V-fold PLP-dependent enzyme [Actinomycetota bacterium]|nr:aminotransferase class V-fold PLP-dependent enzyme [Actinomycetota bacterium]